MTFLRDASTKRPSADTLQTIILEIFCLITDDFEIAITPDNGVLNSALVQLMQDEGFDAVLEHVPKLFAHAQLGSAEFVLRRNSTTCCFELKMGDANMKLGV